MRRWHVADQHVSARDGAYRQQQAEQLLGDTGLDILERAGMTLDRFDPARLHHDAGGEHPYTTMSAWLTAIGEYGARADYRDLASPPAALYCYSPVRGCGKTHLAGAIALEARRQHRLTVWTDELRYMQRIWSCAIEEQPRIAGLVGERAWLAVIDDLGMREKPGPGVRDAWAALFGARWFCAGWTLITSNYTPDELVERGTISLSTYSRIGQMTQQGIVYFDGADQRLGGGAL